jgi:shikimate dehydrogenase
VINAATRVAGIIGDPVRHSLSPLLHNTAYAELGLDWVYLAFAVPEGDTARALDAVRALGLVGLSVTMPHKTAAADAVDDLTDDARVLRSVNTVTLTAERTLQGDSTDGPGFVRALRAAGHEPNGARVLVLGAGGAARPVALALDRAGSNVTISARRSEAAAEAAALTDAGTLPWDDRASECGTATIIVNATPLGMGDGASPLPASALRPGIVVADLVYHPLETPLLADARAAGAETVDGLGMLVQQAALQVERWSGRDAPVAAMYEAVRGALSRVPSGRV